MKKLWHFGGVPLYTFLKINMEPKNEGLQDDFLLQLGDF